MKTQQAKTVHCPQPEKKPALEVTERDIMMLRIGIGLGIDHECSNSIHYHKSKEELVEHYLKNPFHHLYLANS